MKKTVLRVSFNCQKCKTSVLKAVAKLEVVGDVDPVLLVKQIRKTGKAVEVISVGPPKPKSPEPCGDKKPLPRCCKECQP